VIAACACASKDPSCVRFGRRLAELHSFDSIGARVRTDAERAELALVFREECRAAALDVEARRCAIAAPSVGQAVRCLPPDLRSGSFFALDEPEEGDEDALAITCPPGATVKETITERSCRTIDGKRHGPTIVVEDGRRVAETHYAADVPDGPIRMWHANGELRLEGAHLGGQMHGTWTQWRDDGTQVGSFVMDRGTGTMLVWDAEGRKLGEIGYRDGLKDGPERTWWPSGGRRSDGTWQANQKRGRWTQWNEDGTVLSEADH
jgi:antitoxin component YwqK of YwqJK toxin-antitoxin module